MQNKRKSNAREREAAAFSALIVLGLIALVGLQFAPALLTAVTFWIPAGMSLGYPYSLIGGMLGGCLRRLLRLQRSRGTDLFSRPADTIAFSMPLLTAVLALVCHALAATDVLPLVDESVYRRPAGAFGISVVVGLFSDDVLEKLRTTIRHRP